jgi:uncharacterized protein with FMN-binding domain
MQEEKGIRRLKPLRHLWPAALTICLIAGTLPLTQPVLAALPQRLEAPEQQTAEPTPSPSQTKKLETPVVSQEPEPAELAAVLEANYQDGTYTGSAQGYGGTITVQVTVENGLITAVDILDAAGETDSFFNRAMGVVEQVLTRQTWEVDAVSGATYSSKGILAAIQAALTGQQVVTEAPAQTVQTAATLTTVAYTEPQNGYRDGTYYGSATGFGGTIQVEVVIADGKIVSIRVVSAPGETASYLASATAVIDRVLAANSPQVDTISGATYSSNGILNAIKRALTNATNGDISEPEEPTGTPEETPEETPEPTTPAEPAVPYKDGIYTGTAEGFGGDITVQLTIENGRITAAEILSAQDETPAYLSRAEALLTTMQTAQSPDLDVISGATYSSNGILEAAKIALAQAVQEEPTVEETPELSEVTEEPEVSETPEIPTVSEEPEIPEEPEEPEESEEPEEPESAYVDGTYTATVLCTDDDVFSYQIQVTITIAQGKITGVAVEKQADTSEDPESNDSFLTYAQAGRTRKNVWYAGVPSQIIDRQSADEIDVVSGATYSSQAIGNAARQALQAASREDTK